MTALPTPALTLPVTGQPISQGYLQSQVYNPLNFLLNPPAFKAVATSAQTLSTSGSSYSTLTLQQVDYDTYAGWNVSTNGYTIPVAGRYLAVGSVGFSPSSTGARAVRVSKNGAAFDASSSVTGAASSNTWVGNVSVIDSFNVGDVLSVSAWQTSGGSLTTNAPFPSLMVQFLSF
jgi:hypothetical protein